jgi:hypothetical protein
VAARHGTDGFFAAAWQRRCQADQNGLDLPQRSSVCWGTDVWAVHTKQFLPLFRGNGRLQCEIGPISGFKSSTQ